MAYAWPVRVYWEDTDAGGVVYYANYLKFLERARSEWLRGFGFEQDALRDRDGLAFVVRRVEVDYLAPARFNDSLEVTVTLAALGRASLDIEQAVLRGPTRLVTARVKLACVDAVMFKPARIPSPIIEAVGRAP